MLEHSLETIENQIVCRRSSSFVDKIGEVQHAHGVLNNSPIMGVNDTSQIANSGLANNSNFTDYIIKPDLNGSLRMKNDELGSQMIAKSSIICVYGMSIGRTDKYWWRRVLSWLSADKLRQLIIFLHDSKFSQRTQFDFLEKQTAVFDRFSEFLASSSINISDLKSRIHLAINKNIFEMDLMKAHNETMDEAMKILTGQLESI